MAAKQSLGFIGLGRMGGGLARHAAAIGHRVVGMDPRGLSAELKAAGVEEARDNATLVAALPTPRIVWLYVPAGSVVDDVLADLAPRLAQGDLVIDGGNSYWGDSIRRHRRLAQAGVHFVDAGTSGGPSGALDGACFMVGGEPEVVAGLTPLLTSLAVDGGFVNAGGPGAGHFVKLVHNGIEFGMLQAIGEGMSLLEGFGRPLPVADILETWTHGSVIRSWLVELMRDAYRDRQGLGQTPAYVEDTGEVNWLVDDALHLEVPIPVITQSVVQLVQSRDGSHAAARAIAMMRHGFGGHPNTAKQLVASGLWLSFGQGAAKDGDLGARRHASGQSRGGVDHSIGVDCRLASRASEET